MTADPSTEHASDDPPEEELRWLPGVYQSLIPPAIFAARRSRVADTVGAGRVALVPGAPSAPGEGLFRQSNDFYYLTGVEVPHAYLTIDGADGHSILYLPHHDPEAERVTGPRLHSDDAGQAAAVTGVDEVRPTERLGSDLARHVLKGAPPRFLVPHRPAEGAGQSRDDLLEVTAAALSDPWTPSATRSSHLIGRLAAAFPEAEIADLSPVLDRLRAHKDADELRMLRRAGSLAARGVLEAMRSTQPGVWEYQLAAVAGFVFAVEGARGEGYRAIVGGGTNAWHGHYGRQCDRLVDGDLVLMDYAPDVAYYTSDIGRMWPVNGTFTPAQRALYGFIVHYHRALLSRIKVGAVAAEILDETAEEMTAVHANTPFASEAHRQAALGALSFRGHLSHPVGMSVHDLGDYRSQPLTAGTVISVDPMFWVEQERQYIRCEDTVVVTEDGLENLTAEAPLDCDEIEAAMRQPGLLQQWRATGAQTAGGGR